jgi:hypothetical protein
VLIAEKGEVLLSRGYGLADREQKIRHTITFAGPPQAQAGHDILNEEPELVIEAIRMLVEEIRSQ